MLGVSTAEVSKKLLGKGPIGPKAILDFSQYIFLSKFQLFSADFSRLSVDYRIEQEERKFCVLAKLLFYKFPEEEGK